MRKPLFLKKLTFGVIVSLLIATGVGYMLRGTLEGETQVSQAPASESRTKLEAEGKTQDTGTDEKSLGNQDAVRPAPVPSAQSGATEVQTTPYTNSTHLAIPELPVIRLTHSGLIFDGVNGGYCWPTTGPSGVTDLCVDSIFPDASEMITIPVIAGDSPTVEFEAHETPSRVVAYIFVSGDEPPMQRIELAPNLAVPFVIDLPAGLYFIQFVGVWPEGDVRYTFKVAVSDREN